jgi:acylphosphatase
MIIRRRVFVSGRVQGVSFRLSTFHEVESQKTVVGFVRNLPDGRVEAVFQGKESEVLHMVAWCQRGPRSARVDQVEVVEEALREGDAADLSSRFEIK